MATESVLAIKEALERDTFAYTVSAGMKSARQGFNFTYLLIILSKINLKN